MPVQHATHAHPTSFRFHKDYDYRGAVERALTKGDDVDTADVPAKALKVIGDWTDTTWAHKKAFVGHDAVFVHVDDMLAAGDADEGFIASNATGHLVASGTFKTDGNGDLVEGSIRFDAKPRGMSDG